MWIASHRQRLIAATTVAVLNLIGGIRLKPMPIGKKLKKTMAGLKNFRTFRQHATQLKHPNSFDFRN
jgi:hypothetical protein